MQNKRVQGSYKLSIVSATASLIAWQRGRPVLHSCILSDRFFNLFYMINDLNSVVHKCECVNECLQLNGNSLCCLSISFFQMSSNYRFMVLLGYFRFKVDYNKRICFFFFKHATILDKGTVHRYCN